MKKVNAKDIDELARLKRKYAKTGDVDIIQSIHNLACKISTEICGDRKLWLSISEFFEALCGINPIKRCSNEEIYKFFEMLGVEVVKEKEEESA